MARSRVNAKRLKQVNSVSYFPEYSKFEDPEEENFQQLHVAPEVVHAYQEITNCLFKGKYIGRGKRRRAMFEFERCDPENKKLDQLFSTIFEALLDPDIIKIWIGFLQEHKHLKIYAPEDCALSPCDRDKEMTFQITDVQLFDFDYSPRFDYRVGVNLRVEKCNSFGLLKAAYEKLEGMKFLTRDHYWKSDEFGKIYTAYRVDSDFPENQPVINAFKTIKKLWLNDGQKVYKPFIEKRDTNPLLILGRLLPMPFLDWFDDYDDDDDEIYEDEQEEEQEENTCGDEDEEVDSDGACEEAESGENQNEGEYSEDEGVAGETDEERKDEEKKMDGDVPHVYDRGRQFKIYRVVFTEFPSEQQFTWKVDFAIVPCDDDDDDDDDDNDEVGEQEVGCDFRNRFPVNNFQNIW